MVIYGLLVELVQFRFVLVSYDDVSDMTTNLHHRKWMVRQFLGAQAGLTVLHLRQPPTAVSPMLQKAQTT